MKKRLVMLLVACCTMLSMWAQQQGARPQRLTPEEFKAKQEAFIAKRAGLTPQEATKFFPLYFELQEKKRELNRERFLFPQDNRGEPTEEQCEKILKAIADSKIETAQLEKSYLDKFKEVLSSQKILQVQRAETHFFREVLKNVNDRQQPGEKREGKRPLPPKGK